MKKKELVNVVFDRRKLYAKRGMAYLEVMVYLGRKGRRYITVCTSTPETWEQDAKSAETLEIISNCQKILSAMEVLGEEMTMENFNRHYLGEDKEEVTEETDDRSSQDFIAYCEEALAAEDIKIGTRKHKQVVIDAVKTYGKLKTYGDLTPKNILAFDRWLHNGERSDVTIYGYHKRLKKWVGELARLDEIPRNPYKIVSVTRGKSKERQPLLETELKKMRDYPFDGKLERVRDLFIFSAYTGLAFCDVQNFDYQSMTVKERENPQILNASRKRRIAAGCGLEVVDVNRLLKAFEAMQQMTKAMTKGMTKGKMRGMGAMMGGMGGFGGGSMRSFGRKKRFK